MRTTKTQRSFDGTLSRSIQLDALAYLLIGVLMVAVVMVTAMLFGSIAPPTGWLLSDYRVQMGLLALVGVFVLYLLQQHAVLRRSLRESLVNLDESRAATERALRGLISAHRAAEIMVSLGDERCMQHVCDAVREETGAGAVAIVAEETTLSVAAPSDESLVMESVIPVAVDAVRRGASLSAADDAEESETLAIPLRIMGGLHGVLCVWRRSAPFTSDEREGLQLVARVVELGWESRMLFESVNERLEGTMTIVGNLIDQRVPGYSRRTDRIAELAAEVGRRMGMTPEQVDSLVIATELRDFGILHDDADEPQVHDGRPVLGVSHPVYGAQFARFGHFPATVQRAILCHHESPDGSGFPMKLSGADIPLEAKIIKACEAFVERTPRQPGPDMVRDALQALDAGAGTQYDAGVVSAIARTVLLRPAAARRASDLGSAA